MTKTAAAKEKAPLTAEINIGAIETIGEIIEIAIGRARVITTLPKVAASTQAKMTTETVIATEIVKIVNEEPSETKSAISFSMFSSKILSLFQLRLTFNSN